MAEKKIKTAKKTAPAKKAATKKTLPTGRQAAAAKKSASAKPAEKKGKLAEIKTKETDASVEDFINRAAEGQKREDTFTILEMMKKATGEEPKMWGTSIIGFGNRRYKSPATGREVDWLKIGFSPRKANISLYLSMDINKHTATLAKLGKHKTGVGCLYINKLDDIDVKVLKGLIENAVKLVN